MFPYGKLDKSKNLLVFVAMGSDGSMDLGIAIKGGGTFSQVDLSGTWSTYIFESSPTMGNYWLYGSFKLDSLGNVLSGSYVTPDGMTISVSSGNANLDENGGLNAVLNTEAGLSGTFPLGKMGKTKSLLAFVGMDALGAMDLGIAVKNEAVSQAGIQSRLYYLHIASNSRWETEICIINTSQEQLSGTIELYDNQSTFLYGRNLNLNGYGRNALTVGNEFSNPEDIGYIIFSSNCSNICGYTKFYQEGRYRVAIPAVKNINTGDIYIPHIASNDRWWTGLSLVNTTATQKTLSINFNNGATRLMDMEPGEHKSFTIKSFFGDLSQPDIKSAVIADGKGIIGLELFSSGNQLSGVLLKDEAVNTLYFPHVASNQRWWTGIVAYNPNASDANLEVTPYTDTGTALGAITANVSAGGKYFGSANDLILPETTAWFKVDADQPLNGFELFGTASGNSLAGYSVVNINHQEGVFAKMENAGWTGIAFVNTSNSDADIFLSLYDDNGLELSEQFITLKGNEKVVDNPENIFSGEITGGTYIKFDANKDVVGFQLNGSTDSMMLDGLPAM